MRRVAASVLLIAFAVVCSVAVWAQDDGTIRGCAKVVGGQLRILLAGQSCQPSERAVEWSPAAPGGTGGLRIVDANNTQVGWLMATIGFMPNAIMRVGDSWLSISVTPMRIGQDFPEPEFYFDVPCQADGSLHDVPGYVKVEGPALTRMTKVLRSTPALLYYAGPIDPNFTPVSVEQTSLSGQRGCFSTSANPNDQFGPVQSLDVSVFVPPYTISQ